MAGSDVRAITFLNSLSASNTSVAAAATTSGTASLTLTTAAGTGAFHATNQAAKVTLTSTLRERILQETLRQKTLQGLITPQSLRLSFMTRLLLWQVMGL